MANRVRLYTKKYSNGDNESASAYIDESGYLKIKIYETGDELEAHTGDWDRETFITVPETNFPPNILNELEQAGEAWRKVLSKYKLTYQSSVW